MTRRVIVPRVALGAVAIVLLLAAGAGIGVLAASNTTFYACFNPTTRALDKVSLSAPSICGSGETPVSWNANGPTGATGATGPTGPIGPAGPVWVKSGEVAADGTHCGTACGEFDVYTSSHISTGIYELQFPAGSFEPGKKPIFTVSAGPSALAIAQVNGIGFNPDGSATFDVAIATPAGGSVDCDFTFIATSQ